MEDTMGTATTDDKKTDDSPKPDVKRAEAERRQAEKDKTFARPGTEKRG